MKRSWMALACTLLLSACASLVPVESVPDTALPVPGLLTGAAVEGDGRLSAETALAWRDVIVNADLKDTVELALNNNRDLRVAALNVEATRVQYGIQVAGIGPTVNAGATATAGTTRSATVSLGVAAWELDLWGRLSSLKGAALATFLASEKTRDSV